MLTLCCLFALLADPAREVRMVLERQQAAWNRGDVRAFVEDYDAEAVFAGGGTFVHGRDQVLARYLKRYPTAAEMGKLTFTEVDVTPLGEFYASVTGRFRLEKAGQPATGIFTLLFRNRAGAWKIVLDHTS